MKNSSLTWKQGNIHFSPLELKSIRLSVCRVVDWPGSGVGVVFSVAVTVLDKFGSTSRGTLSPGPAWLLPCGLSSNCGEVSSTLGVGIGDIRCLLRGPSLREDSRYMQAGVRSRLLQGPHGVPASQRI